MNHLPNQITNNEKDLKNKDDDNNKLKVEITKITKII